MSFEAARTRLSDSADGVEDKTSAYRNGYIAWHHKSWHMTASHMTRLLHSWVGKKMSIDAKSLTANVKKH